MDFEKQIQTDRESLIQDIMKLVSIDSVETAPDAGMPFGAGAAKALDCFLETAESIGLKTENFDHYAGHADYGDQEETLGILGHVDVVPCSGSWVCDPFKPEIIDGKLYGRGVLDDKGPLLACLHAVKILKEMGVPLSKKIRFIVGANEETDWKCMDYYFNKKKIPAPQMSFTPDAPAFSTVKWHLVCVSQESRLLRITVSSSRGSRTEAWSATALNAFPPDKVISSETSVTS